MFFEIAISKKIEFSCSKNSVIVSSLFFQKSQFDALYSAQYENHKINLILEKKNNE